MLSVSSETPVVSIIIDDLGTNYRNGRAALNLPGAITYSILPQRPYSRTLAIRANETGKEVMMHQPMESTRGLHMGAGGISSHMNADEIYNILNENFSTVPYSSGINNHMGSMLTTDPDQMYAVMSALKRRGDYYFVDSITTRDSVALYVADNQHVPNTRRNIFLDNKPNSYDISLQFDQLIAQAKKVGSSIAIGHPYPETIAALNQLLPRLSEHGIQLIAVSQMIQQRKMRERSHIWQASLSPLQKAPKSSKQ